MNCVILHTITSLCTNVSTGKTPLQILKALANTEGDHKDDPIHIDVEEVDMPVDHCMMRYCFSHERHLVCKECTFNWTRCPCRALVSKEDDPVDSIPKGTNKTRLSGHPIAFPFTPPPIISLTTGMQIERR